jgi:hypothetical protein
MTNPRISDEYIDSCRLFVDFAIQNCKTPDGLIHCPRKTCHINRQHPPGLVYEHLTGGKGMWPQYKDWIYHGEQPVGAPVEGSNLNRPATDAGPNTEDVGGNMQAMLCDLFCVHDVWEDHLEPQPEAQGGEEQILDDAPDTGDAQKYNDLLKKAEKPLHGQTRHSKLNAIVHLYNLKCLGRVSQSVVA